MPSHTLIRTLLVGLLLIAVSGGTAAGVAYLMLADTTWTDARPARPAATATAVPAPSAPTTTADPTSRWRLGTCLTEQLAPVDCSVAGAYRISGVVQDPGPAPCTGIPGDPIARPVDGTVLCLTRH
ncbi:hypothetical protein [Streptomyces sp. NPDC029526]|uniref:hypothetical protein n=1 Tax=Streptomyces sp. NPDC029526 TaxID=3155728 RepID=UPI00340BFBEE